MDIPFGFKAINCQPFEQLFFSFEIRFECRKQQAFAEASRTAQKIGSTSGDQFIYESCFIDIEITFCTKLLKFLYPDRELSEWIYRCHNECLLVVANTNIANLLHSQIRNVYSFPRKNPIMPKITGIYYCISLMCTSILLFFSFSLISSTFVSP